MTLRFHEIAESGHRILNPLTGAKLGLLGDICRPPHGARHLDLACGKGELVCRWAQRFGTAGVGVDISQVFLRAAVARAHELGVSDAVRFVHGDAGAYAAERHAFDVVSCLGATWIGGGLVGTLDLMRAALTQDGLLLVGEPYWIDPPPAAAIDAVGAGEDFADLAGTLERFHAAGVELVEMVLADGDSWDRYVAAQWRTLDDWLRAHPDDPDRVALRDWHVANQRTYLEYGRRFLGWGVFVLRHAG